MDARVPLASVLEAFGVSIQVTRPEADHGPVSTTGVWQPMPMDEANPFGADLQRRDPRKVLAVPRTAALSHVPRGTVILAPEIEGEAPTSWRVDGYARQVEHDLMRLVVIPVTDVI